MEDIKFSELKKAIDKLGKEYISELSKQLIKADKVASGKLLRSLKYEVVEVLNNLMVRVKSEAYLSIVDKGRRPGKMPPISPIKKWIQIRRIKPDKKMSDNQLAFAIAKSIAKKGIKPTGVLDKTIKQILKNKTDILSKAALKDVERELSKILHNL